MSLITGGNKKNSA